MPKNVVVCCDDTDEEVATDPGSPARYNNRCTVDVRLSCLFEEKTVFKATTAERLLFLCGVARSHLASLAKRRAPPGSSAPQLWDDVGQFPPEFALAHRRGEATVNGDTRPMMVMEGKRERAGDRIRELWRAVAILSGRGLLAVERIPHPPANPIPTEVDALAAIESVEQLCGSLKTSEAPSSPEPPFTEQLAKDPRAVFNKERDHVRECLRLACQLQWGTEESQFLDAIDLQLLLTKATGLGELGLMSYTFSRTGPVSLGQFRQPSWTALIFEFAHYCVLYWRQLGPERLRLFIQSQSIGLAHGPLDLEPHLFTEYELAARQFAAEHPPHALVGPVLHAKDTSMTKVKVLFLAANPIATQPLRLGQEVRDIRERIRAAEHGDSLDLHDRCAVRPADLVQALNELKPHIVHFSGHGSRSKRILLEGTDGTTKPVTKEGLVALFEALKDNVRVVVLNACYSQEQAEAITKVIDCAIGMDKSIRDDVAINFAATFYGAVGFGRSIQNAYDQAIAAIQLEGLQGRTIPKLHVRSGVDAAQLILVKSP